MTRNVLYVAHCLRPSEDEIEYQKTFGAAEHIQRWTGKSAIDQAIQANVQRALRWLAWLRKTFPETTFIAPWICDILSGADDTDPAQREAGMQGNFAVIERCDGIVLCGHRISEGMRRECEHGEGRMMTQECPNYFEAFDLTPWGAEPSWPPSATPPGMSFDRWHSALLHGRLE